jgi:flagellar hook-basal body complex protein FliE
MSSQISGTSFIKPVLPEMTTSPTGSGEQNAGFGSALKNAMNQAEQLSSDADQQVRSLLQGDGQNMHTVMIAMQKADVAFQMMMQVRNKIVTAYQDISHLQF